MESTVDFNIEETISQLTKYVLAAVKPERYAHSRRTAETCERLCVQYGEDPRMGFLAGIAHDMCKDAPEKLVIALSQKDGLPITALEQNKPSLLHGRAAAVLLRTDFNVPYDDVLLGVANHTFGCPGLSNLGKILYNADKIEPGRPYVTSKYLERFKNKTLDEMTAMIVGDNISFLEQKGRSIAPISRQFLKELLIASKKADK